MGLCPDQPGNLHAENRPKALPFAKTLHTFAVSIIINMGKGDIKTRKGKLANGSFGKRRLRNETRPRATAAEAVAEAPAKAKAAAKPRAKKAEK